MKTGVVLRLLVLTSAIAVMASCETARDPASVVAPTARIQPLCQLGCVPGGDPNPDAPGIYLEGVTPDYCSDGTDLDQDGLSDACEKFLAQYFAPELAYSPSPSENVSKEPHWVAEWNADWPGAVNVMYLLSYYLDLGSPAEICGPFHDYDWCSGHYGDSEWIMLTVYYDFETQHWVLGKATYSQHKGWEEFIMGSAGYPTRLSYPGHSGGYPRAYVAFWKHANYATDADCDRGGEVRGTDECYQGGYARVAAAAGLNLGSRLHPFADAVYSTNPLYGDRGPEYYWTDRWFCGWQGVQCDHLSGSYARHLGSMGF